MGGSTNRVPRKKRSVSDADWREVLRVAQLNDAAATVADRWRDLTDLVCEASHIAAELMRDYPAQTGVIGDLERETQQLRESSSMQELELAEDVCFLAGRLYAHQQAFDGASYGLKRLAGKKMKASTPKKRVLARRLYAQGYSDTEIADAFVERGLVGANEAPTKQSINQLRTRDD